MRRLLSCAVLLLAVGMFISLLSPGALAQTATRQPVIDSAPRRVHYRAGATVVGHLEGWVAGDQVSLQRSLFGNSWTTVATKPVDEAGKVAFQLSEMRRTSLFRLVHHDESMGTQTFSSNRKIRVGAKLTLRLSRDNVMQGGTVTAYGRLTSGPGRYVAIQQRADGRWRTLGTAYERDGRYALRFEANRIGPRRIRAVFRGDERNLPARSREGLRVYDPALATWYGPGLYGNRTACGKTLRGDTLGVAHRWLPCGTRVAVLYRGRTIVVEVIDRGPYTSAEWDLTEETAQRLGFSGRNKIGVDTDNG